jgi:NADPH:quinone reductase-like Zn-dependent oxidoreductase
MPALLVRETPGKASDEQVASISLVIMATALYHKSSHGIPTPWINNGKGAGGGKPFIIFGESSSVGQYAIQLARISGFKLIATHISLAHFTYLQILKTTTVFNRPKATSERMQRLQMA